MADRIQSDQLNSDLRKKKILFCASTISHINNFHLPYIEAFHNLDYEVWVIANEAGYIKYADKVINLPIEKNFLSVKNIKAVIAARNLLNVNQFEFISTHTTLASAIIRLAAIFVKKDIQVFCTVHGYLFNENDKLKKWIYLIFEKLCARATDVLMVMNQEDYRIAQKYKLYKKNLYFIEGMGIDLSMFQTLSSYKRKTLREEIGISEDEYLMVYAAEFSKRKNHKLLISAFSIAYENMRNAKLLLAGDGMLIEECRKLAISLNMENHIVFLGHVKNIFNLYPICDACVTSSKSEGLPFNIMEAMACELPVIASDVKGNNDLVQNGKTGILYALNEPKELINAMVRMYNNEQERAEMGQRGRRYIVKYGIEDVLKKVMDIYKDNMK